MKDNQINFWTAILDIINAVLFFISWLIFLWMSFSEIISHGTAKIYLFCYLFCYLMADIGAVLSIASLIQSQNMGIPIAGSIFSIIGNLLFFITKSMALPAIVMLVIAIILLFIHKESKKTVTGKQFYKIEWFWIITAVLTILLFVSHSANKSIVSTPFSGQTKTNKTITNSKKRQNDNYTFKNGTFKCSKYTIKITKTKIGIDKENQINGIIIFFNIKNFSKKSIQTLDSLYCLRFEQSNGKSTYDLDSNFNSSEALFPTFNDDGSIITDSDLYDSNTSRQEKFQELYEDPLNAVLLPGKTVTVVQGFKLKDLSHPIYVKAYKNSYSTTTVGQPYKISLQ